MQRRRQSWSNFSEKWCKGEDKYDPTLLEEDKYGQLLLFSTQAGLANLHLLTLQVCTSTSTFVVIVGEWKFFNLLTSASTVSRPTLTYTQALGDEPYKIFLTFWETIRPEHCSPRLTSRYAETGSVSEEESGTWRRSSVPLLNHQVFTPPTTLFIIYNLR